MPICQNCKNTFPNAIYINGKRKTLHKRKYCLDCVKENDRSAGLRLAHKTTSVEVNKKYNKLLVTDIAPTPEHLSTKNTYRYFWVECDCGNKKIMREESIRKYGSCGCGKSVRTVKYGKTHFCKRCQQDLPIDNFSEYSVPKKNGSSFFYRKNECKSCIVKKTKKWVTETTIGKYSAIKSGALNRGIDFNITLEEFESLYDKPCHYCGGERPTRGLDRKNSDGPYSLDNVVPCCRQCNTLKNVIPYEDFISIITKISKNINQ